MQNLLPAKKLLLIILDGFGVARDSEGNALSQAKPENLIGLWNTYPHTYLMASGEDVGLPPHTNGNSEVGHLNLGAGRVMYQNLPRINRKIKTGDFYKNDMLVQAAIHAKKNGSNIHLMGCLSDGSIHAHINHFKAALKFFSQVKLNKKSKLFVHAFTDGRDAPIKSAGKYLAELNQEMKKLNTGSIASICGRAIAMDRNEDWDKTEKAYEMLVKGKGHEFKNWGQALHAAYQREEIDEYIEPSIILQEGGEKPVIKENDLIIFMNFRADRALQLSKAFEEERFNEFPTEPFNNLFFASMVEYAKDFPEKVIYPKEYIKLPVGRIIAEHGMRQLRIAESEKFPHVTYFFNGGVALKYEAENRIEVASPDVATYDQRPEMSALEITDILKERIASDYYNFIVLNFANGDMVAHTGNLEASKLAVQVVDYCVGELVKRFLARDGTVVITADHGNVEEIIKPESGQIDTEHSENPVPFMIINNHLANGGGKNLKLGKLADVSPTILKLMGLEIPSEMSGDVLI
jgi:2,3-bisphosphoglycerate-independent phosphoglycerate mutase